MRPEETGPWDDPFEAALAGRLERRAAGLPVQPDLDGLTTRAAVGPSLATIPSPSGPRRPVPMVLAVAAVIVVGLVGVVAVTRLGNGGGDLATEDRSSETDAAAATDDSESEPEASAQESLVIWLELETTPAQAAELAAWLDLDPAVQSHIYVDEAATYREFTELFADEPELIDLVERSQLPTSFTVVTSDPGAIEAAEERFAFVDDVRLDAVPGQAAPGSGLPPDQAVIWLDVDATAEDVTEIAAWLDQRPEVTDYVYIDRDATYVQFLEYFADEPEIIELVVAEDLPTSFEVSSADPWILVEARTRFDAVEDVEIADGELNNPDPDAED